MNNQSIIQYAKSRHIEDCVHFTNVLNLKSIINYGLLPKSTLKEESMNFQENDVYRYDGFENATSLSITFPNYKMFYSIRTQDTSKNWAVLVIDAYSVLSKKCAFNYTNAANHLLGKIAIEERMTVDSFKKMFSENNHYFTREQLKLSDNETTDPQAEILLFEEISYKSIKFVYFESEDVYNEYKDFLNKFGILSCVNIGYFLPRRDYSCW